MADPTQARFKTILYVCDDSSLGTTRAQVLEREGYEVVLSSDVQEGRKHWRERRRHFDLVLFEISGDVRPALDLCEEIKREQREQLYAVLTSARTYLSPKACPDNVLHKDDGPRSVLDQVNALLAQA